VSVTASPLVYEVQFVNSFSSHQQLTLVATPIDVDSNILSYPCVPVPISPKMSSFNLFMVVITYCKFHQNLFSMLVKRTKYILDETNRRRNRQKLQQTRQRNNASTAA